MGHYHVRVHDTPPNTTVTVVHNVSEYEVDAESLALACEMVFHMPVRTAPPVTRLNGNAFGPGPGHRDWTPPPRSGFDAVAEFTRKDRTSLDAALARSDEELSKRARKAISVAAAYTADEAGTILDCVTLSETWDNREADHVALLRTFVEKEWIDEEGLGRTWFTDLHEKLAKAGVDGPVERRLAEGVYWDKAREIVAEVDAERDAAQARP